MHVFDKFVGSITYPELTRVINVYHQIVVSASEQSYLTLTDLHSSIKSLVIPFATEEIF